MDFNEITEPDSAERIRAWSMEKAIVFFSIGGTSGSLVDLASEIEDFVKNGKKD